ncbi:hypothetical protein CVT24_000718 [Panaeolus cyanescens]|uniref:Uncharacterized protein n=1 Tax=Panaeolus cyanescens TaxID=181874 RepID=A0A409YT35_9AGAR|nr:hypothetical protein CVT24_000718 [Panaeolus cyanescens]
MVVLSLATHISLHKSWYYTGHQSERLLMLSYGLVLSIISILWFPVLIIHDFGVEFDLKTMNAYCVIMSVIEGLVMILFIGTLLCTIALRVYRRHLKGELEEDQESTRDQQKWDRIQHSYEQVKPFQFDAADEPVSESDGKELDVVDEHVDLHDSYPAMTLILAQPPRHPRDETS